MSRPDWCPEEIERYAARCREMSQDGEYQWWSRLADILDATPAAIFSAKREQQAEIDRLNKVRES